MNAVTLQCRVDVFEAPERVRYDGLRSAMKAAVRGVEELPHGYALRLAPDADVFVKVAEWITLERRCCPFLGLAVRWAETGDVSLELTGSAEVKAFLASRLS